MSSERWNLGGTGTLSGSVPIITRTFQLQTRASERLPRLRNRKWLKSSLLCRMAGDPFADGLLHLGGHRFLDGSVKRRRSGLRLLEQVIDAVDFHHRKVLVAAFFVSLAQQRHALVGVHLQIAVAV